MAKHKVKDIILLDYIEGLTLFIIEQKNIDFQGYKLFDVLNNETIWHSISFIDDHTITKITNLETALILYGK